MSTVLRLQLSYHVGPRDQLGSTSLNFIEPALGHFDPFGGNLTLLISAQAVEEIMGEPASLFDGKLHRLFENLVDCLCHDESVPRPYLASTASLSFSAWKCEISGSMTTSRLPFMTSGRLCTVRPMRWSVTRSCGKL